MEWVGSGHEPWHRFHIELIGGLNQAGSKTEKRGSEGWTGLQTLHHIADSHLNGFCCTKLALTEEKPAIRPYEEQAWALLPDYDLELVDTTLDLLQALHAKWAYLFRHLNEQQWHRTFVHPASGMQWKLYQHIVHYAWHGEHHLRHIELSLGI